MKRKSKTIIGAALESMFPYELGMVVPPDPLTGSNATTEHNPQAVADQENALARLEAIRPGITKILTAEEPWRARAKYLSPVGYHGMINAPDLALNASMESNETPSDYSPVIQEIYGKHFKPFKNAFSQEGVFEKIFERIFHGNKAKEIPAAEQLAELETALKTVKTPAALALLEGRAEPPKGLIGTLEALAHDHPAPSQVFKSNAAMFANVVKLVQMAEKLPEPESVRDALKKAETSAEVKAIVTGYLKAQPPMSLLKTRPVVIAKPQPKGLFDDVTKNYESNLKQLAALKYDKNGYDFLTLALRKWNWVSATIDDQDSTGIAALYDEDPDTFDDLLKKTEQVADAWRDFEDNWYDFDTDDTAGWLCKGRIALAKAVLELEQTKGYSEEAINACVDRALLEKLHSLDLSLSQEGAFGELFSHVMEELQSLLQSPAAPALLKTPEVRKYIEETPEQVLSQESIDTRGLSMPKFDLTHYSMEELSAHNIEAMRNQAETRNAELAAVTQELAASNPGSYRLVKLCADGILYNEGNICDLLEKTTGDRPCLDSYRKLFSAQKFPGRVLAAGDGGDNYYRLVSQAAYFVRDLVSSGLQTLLQEGKVVAAVKLMDDLVNAEFIKASAVFPNAMEYSCAAVDDFLDSYNEDREQDPTFVERMMLSTNGGFAWLEQQLANTEAALSQCMPQALFQALGRQGDEFDQKLSVLAMNTLKAVLILDRGGIHVMEQVQLQRNINQEETLRLLRALQVRSQPVTPEAPAATYSQEAFDYTITQAGALHHAHAELVKKDDFAGLQRSLFGWGAQKTPTKQRESQKPAKDRTTGGLVSELNEYQAKAIAAFQGPAPAILEFPKHGIAQEERYYNDLAKTLNVKGFSHDRFYAPYLKAQTGVTTYLLDYAKQLLTPKSDLQHLTTECINFGLLYNADTNMKSMIDAINGRRQSNEELLALGRKVCDLFAEWRVVGTLRERNITDATKLVKPVSKYDIASLEQVCPNHEALDDCMGDEYNISRNYGAYQSVCFQLNCCVNLADYYMRENRPLGLLFTEASETLYAIADILAFRLYTSIAMNNSYQNLLIGKIFFIDELLKTQ